jgi:UDP-N-acetylmuramoyl-L-alanyl-D-glutamate--2,6-diaminopimelate ligase
MPHLIDLIRPVPETLEYSRDAEKLSITGITSDSRQVKPGYLFAALKGSQSDGTKFIGQAKQSGAIAVLCGKSTNVSEPGIAAIKATDPRLALAHMAAAFYGTQPKHIAAVTGTDGKTSTADFFRQFWHLMGKKTASIGTLGILSGSGEALYPGSHTTPDPVQLHKLLAELHGKRIEHVAMEASSHGLHQYRLDGVHVQAAAFTNIARDHLDYHHTEEAYFAAKSRLFSELLPEGATAVLNEDDDKFGQMKAICAKRKHDIIGFGKNGSQFKVIRIEPLPHGQRAGLELFDKSYLLDIPLVGAFQVMNILAALGLVVGCGGKLDKALAVIPELNGVPGRLEQVARLANGATVFIDYAHTPMALANILKTLRPHTKKQLHVVFGCGGDRDKGKRPEMGKIANTLADRVIVTDDNPRSEEPGSIRKAILAAAPDAKEVADRREAIYVGLKSLNAGDILVIAGKGHEKTQIVGDKTFPFDDAEVAREAAKELKLVA